jgi:hypothetical protein
LTDTSCIKRFIKEGLLRRYEEKHAGLGGDDAALMVCHGQQLMYTFLYSSEADSRFSTTKEVFE